MAKGVYAKIAGAWELISAPAAPVVLPAATGGTEATLTNPDGDGKNYKTHTFTVDGNLVVTQAGRAKVLCVGPGASTSGNGNGGPVVLADIDLPVGTHAVVVGISATGQGASDWTGTRIGRLAAAGPARLVNDRGDDGGSGTANGVVSTITGASHEYGAGGSRKATLTNAADRYGIGGDPAIANRAGGGFVVVRYEVA